MAKCKKCLEDLSSEQLDDLNLKLAVYISSNYYFHAFNGITLFKYGSLVSDSDGKIYLNLNSKNAIYSRDASWEEGVKNIANKFGVNINLPNSLYIK